MNFQPISPDEMNFQPIFPDEMNWQPISSDEMNCQPNSSDEMNWQPISLDDILVHTFPVIPDSQELPKSFLSPACQILSCHSNPPFISSAPPPTPSPEVMSNFRVV